MSELTEFEEARRRRRRKKNWRRTKKLAVVLAVAVFLIARWMLWHRYQLQMAVLRREEALAQERARISRDIHDDLGNGLSVVATLSELAHGDVEKGILPVGQVMGLVKDEPTVAELFERTVAEAKAVQEKLAAKVS